MTMTITITAFERSPDGGLAAKQRSELAGVSVHVTDNVVTQQWDREMHSLIFVR